MNLNENGIYYRYIKSDRFKTTHMSVTFYLPLDNNASSNALAACLMSKGTYDLPDYYSFNRKLAGLYGASVSRSIAKSGDHQEININITVNDDKYSINNEPTVNEAGALLCDMLFGYVINAVEYPQNAVLREKRLIKETIESRFNDKRVYARKRCEEIMCDGEAYGLSAYGTVQDVEKLTDEDISAAQKRLLSNSLISIVVIGEKEPTCFISDFNRLITTVGRDFKPLNKDLTKKASKLKTVSEKMPVQQGKLVIGMRSENSEILPDSVKTWVMTDIFGGGPYSKLFCNVREKLSLCYYCSARGIRSKGIIFIDSGVEEQNIDSAKNAIIEQFDKIKNGEISENELKFSKLALCDAFRSIEADQHSLAQWYDARILSGRDASPEEVIEAIKNVTLKDIITSAKSYELDTIYMLCPDIDAKEVL